LVNKIPERAVQISHKRHSHRNVYEELKSQAEVHNQYIQKSFKVKINGNVTLS